jgi:hypothetical protein
MSHEILINVTPQETRVAMLEQGVVQELHIERASARGLVGNICIGRVARVLPGMQSAFIEIVRRVRRSTSPTSGSTGRTGMARRYAPDREHPARRASLLVQ